ncbi:hypothetical protein WDW37_06480 [Bdellovibrionota bacterium FG-1]
MKNNIALVYAALTLPGIPLTGKIFSDIYLPARDLDTSSYHQVSASAWLQGDPKLGENGYARFILTADTLDSAANSPGANLGLREGYVGYAKNGWEFRLGRQLIPWGKSDAFNPTDYLSAKNYALFNPDDEVRRIGSTSLWLNWTPTQGASPLSVTVVATPAFPQSHLLIPSSAIPAGVTLVPPPQTPPTTFGNTETAIKLAYTGNAWDASLSAFRGYNHMPEFAIFDISGSPLQPVITLVQTFHPIRAAGGDASFTFGKWIGRAETAYFWTQNDDGTQPLIQPSHWDSVIGAERPLGDDFRFQVQAIYRYHPAFQEPTALAKANALLLGYQEKSRPAATFRLAYSNEANGWDIELFLMANFSGGDYLARPKVTYAWTDAVKSTAGVEYYGGPDDRPLGALKSYNSVFIEGKYVF